MSKDLNISSNGQREPIRMNCYETDEAKYIELKQTITEPTKVHAVTIPFFPVLFMLALSFAGVTCIRYDGNVEEAAQALVHTAKVLSAEFTQGEPQISASETLETMGVVFADIDSRLLSEKDLEWLRKDTERTEQELIGFAINSVYAQHGFDYTNNSRYYSVFQNFEWYSPETTDDSIVEDDFNDYERKNISFLAEARS